MRNFYIHDRITALAAELRRLEQRERDEAVDKIIAPAVANTSVPRTFRRGFNKPPRRPRLPAFQS
jgi:hypothetical protein